MSNLGALAALVAIGAAWGFTFPMTRIAVSTGYQPLGLIFWQLAFMLPVLTVFAKMRGLRLVLAPKFLGLFAVVALSGTVIPNIFSYTAAAQLPAGIMAILIAIVPMFALPMALAMGLERVSIVRMVGVGIGAVAIVMLVGPDASLPPGTSVIFIFVALVASACYGVEGNYLAWRGMSGLDPVQVLFGATVVALILVTPISVLSGQWIDLTATKWGPPERAMLASAIVHSIAYVGYVWLIGRAGPVFASQVAYLVTAFGVVWSMVLLGERYSPWVWASFVLMMAGIALVHPKKNSEVIPES